MMSGVEAQDAVMALFERVSSARSVVAFTGAGISTECGVPDFRSPGSPWMRNRPIPFDAFVASAEAQAEAWRRKFAMDDSFAGALPGRGHRALAHLVRRDRMSAVITQNIDGLHHASGIAPERIVELHGNGTYAACLGCGLRHELAPIRLAFEQTGRLPTCIACGGLVKSATISFGQAMPQDQVRRARSLAEACDLFLAIGSSLVVYPAATLPLLARRAGATLVIINREPTDFDDIADLVIRDDIGDVLEPLLRVE
ncbi:MAG: Sir2 family NAD-dependent protein deacetylase [Beijerinckiaceae bacterium]|jgi:NAD-dependent deacetylase|nr:Sir2 family NAD-dependent protein deacetylase [Beijerinckiaceae bacterium]